MQRYRQRVRQGEVRPQAWARHASPEERILSQVEKQPNGCWYWTGFITPQGYGTTSYHGERGTPVHRAAYDLLVGPIPDGLTIDHLCHTQDKTCQGGKSCLHRRCINPDHLEPVTAVENTKRGSSSRRTHCPAGHPYDAENTLVYEGRRFCRECNHVRGATYRARKKAERTAVTS